MRKTWYGWYWSVDGNYASGFCFTFHQMVTVIRRFTYPKKQEETCPQKHLHPRSRK